MHIRIRCSFEGLSADGWTGAGVRILKVRPHNPTDEICKSQEVKVPAAAPDGRLFFTVVEITEQQQAEVVETRRRRRTTTDQSLLCGYGSLGREIAAWHAPCRHQREG